MRIHRCWSEAVLGNHLVTDFCFTSFLAWLVGCAACGKYLTVPMRFSLMACVGWPPLNQL